MAGEQPWSVVSGQLNILSHVVYRKGGLSSALSRFTIYTTPLAAILRQHDIGYHLFEDDTQLYLEYSLLDNIIGAAAIMKMELCVAMVRSWMHRKKRRLNGERT